MFYLHLYVRTHMGPYKPLTSRTFCRLSLAVAHLRPEIFTLRAALLKGGVALALQFDWSEGAGCLSRAELERAIFPSLMTLAHRIGKAAQLNGLPVNESVSLLISITQARRHPCHQKGLAHIS